ncbi:hypothetical protein OJAV_G00187330 [Oryzias javanicus]|uniref:Uncharacterized protein n=1 Tax=Oryzias javanicus TaxID=123683 RepID=A0A437CA14_ORYJA|nr:hypothetical protein OJAV_G00187330 [Oryzias javanicus]
MEDQDEGAREDEFPALAREWLLPLTHALTVMWSLWKLTAHSVSGASSGRVRTPRRLLEAQFGRTRSETDECLSGLKVGTIDLKMF